MKNIENSVSWKITESKWNKITLDNNNFFPYNKVWDTVWIYTENKWQIKCKIIELQPECILEIIN